MTDSINQKSLREPAEWLILTSGKHWRHLMVGGGWEKEMMRERERETINPHFLGWGLPAHPLLDCLHCDRDDTEAACHFGVTKTSNKRYSLSWMWPLFPAHVSKYISWSQVKFGGLEAWWCVNGSPQLGNFLIQWSNFLFPVQKFDIITNIVCAICWFMYGVSVQVMQGKEFTQVSNPLKELSSYRNTINTLILNLSQTLHAFCLPKTHTENRGWPGF